MKKNNSNPKLFIELVPSSSWTNNLRKILTSASWDKLRKNSYKKANYQCEICGEVGVFGKGHKVECHEIWSYNDVLNIQKLEGLISLCPICHRVKHFGLSSIRGYSNQCKNQLIKVNNWNLNQVEEHISQAFAIHKKRSKKKWTLDLSWLNDKEIKFKKEYSIKF